MMSTVSWMRTLALSLSVSLSAVCSAASAVVPHFGVGRTNDNYAVAGSVYAAEDFSAGDVSLGCWFKLRNDGARAGNDHPQMVSLSSRNMGSKQISLCCNYYTKPAQPKVFTYVGGGNTTYTAESVPNADYASGWHYAMGTYDHATHTLRLYVDDELVGTYDSVPADFEINGGQKLTIGNEPVITKSRFFEGSVTRVSLWNKVVSEEDAKAMYTARTNLKGDEDGLVGYWPCEDVSSAQSGWTGTIADRQSVRTANDLTVGGTGIDWVADADYPFQPGVSVTTNAMANATWGYVVSGLGDGGNEVACVFTNTTAAMEWPIPSDVTKLDYLIVGGGGGGGGSASNASGGGGGGGAVRAESLENVGGKTCVVVVGEGGSAGSGALTKSGTPVEAANGGTSSLTVDGTFLDALGGGAGGPNRHPGVSGGTGGGGGGGSEGTPGSALASADGGTYGNAGGAGKALSKPASTHVAGGGGGAALDQSGKGHNAATIGEEGAYIAKAGDGGDGVFSSITGVEICYGGGGGGGASKGAEAYIPGAGGAGGGGKGYFTKDDPAVAGADGLGGGGGGAGNGTYGTVAARGGSGVVIIRYATSEKPAPATEGREISNISVAGTTVTFDLGAAANDVALWVAGGETDRGESFDAWAAAGETRFVMIVPKGDAVPGVSGDLATFGLGSARFARVFTRPAYDATLTGLAGSRGAQAVGPYIDTLDTPNLSDRLVADVTAPRLGSGEYESIFSARKDNAANDRTMTAFIKHDQSSSCFRLDYGKYNDSSVNSALSAAYTAAGGRYAVTLDANLASVAPDLLAAKPVKSAAETEDAGGTLLLFAARADSSGKMVFSHVGKFTLHSFKWYGANGALRHDYVPVRSADGTKTMYDRVTGTLLAVTKVGAGAGDFGGEDDTPVTGALTFSAAVEPQSYTPDTQEATYTWKAAVKSGDWCSPANWTTDVGTFGYPSSTLVKARIPSGGGYVIDLKGSTIPLKKAEGALSFDAPAADGATGPVTLRNGIIKTGNTTPAGNVVLDGVAFTDAYCQPAANCHLTFTGTSPAENQELAIMAAGVDCEILGDTRCGRGQLFGTAASPATLTVDGAALTFSSTVANVHDCVLRFLDGGRMTAAKFRIESGSATATAELALRDADKETPRISSSGETKLAGGLKVVVTSAQSAGRYPVVKLTAASGDIAGTDGCTIDVSALGAGWSGTLEYADKTLCAVIEKAENSWTDEPSVTPSRWVVGEPAGTLHLGAAKYGEVKCDHTQEQLNALGVGEHTVTFTVEAKAGEYAGLSKSVTVRVRPQGSASGSIPLTCSNYRGTGALTNFPMLVRISESAIPGFSYDGLDEGLIAFRDADGKELPCEVDTWNPDGESLVWVKVPTLTAETQLTFEWGVESGAKAADVWTAYDGVWHFNELSGTEFADSTGSGKYGDAFVPAVGKDGSGNERKVSCTIGPQKLGGGVALSNDGTGRHYMLHTGDRLRSSAVTVSGWYQVLKLRNTTADMYPSLMRSGAYGKGGFYLQLGEQNDDKKFTLVVNSDTRANLGQNPETVLGGSLHYVVVTIGASGAALWIDGVSRASSADARLTAPTEEVFYPVGHIRSGMADEIRIQPTVASADWIAADFQQQNSEDGVLYAVGGVVANYWTTEPSVTPSRWIEGTAAGKLDFGKAKYGEVVCDHTQADLERLPVGTHTVTFTVAETADYGGLSKSVTVKVAPQGSSIGSIPLTCSNYRGKGALANFPMLVRISEDAIPGFTYAGVDADLIAFKDADGNELPCEVDTWNPDGESLVWVKVPSLTAETAVLLCWGEERKTSSAEVWTAYEHVWHMNERSGRTFADATKSINASGNELLTFSPCDAKNGRGVSVTLKNGVTWAIKMESSTTVGKTFTYAGWYRLPTWKTPGGTDGHSLLSFGDWNSAAGFYLEAKYDCGNNIALVVPKNRVITNFPLSSFSDYQYVVVRGDGSKATLSVNGVSAIASQTISAGYTVSGQLLGEPSTYELTASLDECRLSAANLSDDWIMADYQQQATADGVLYAVGGPSIDDATVTVSPSHADFTGLVLSPTVTVTLNGRTLAEGVGYTVAWSPETLKEVGPYVCTVTGAGVYSGKATGSFRIYGPDNQPVTYDWVGTAGGSWSNPDNWSAPDEALRGYPNSAAFATAAFGGKEDAAVDLGGTFAVTNLAGPGSVTAKSVVPVLTLMNGAVEVEDLGILRKGVHLVNATLVDKAAKEPPASSSPSSGVYCQDAGYGLELESGSTFDGALVFYQNASAKSQYLLAHGGASRLTYYCDRKSWTGERPIGVWNGSLEITGKMILSLAGVRIGVTNGTFAVASHAIDKAAKMAFDLKPSAAQAFPMVKFDGDLDLTSAGVAAASIAIDARALTTDGSYEILRAGNLALPAPLEDFVELQLSSAVTGTLSLSGDGNALVLTVAACKHDGELEHLPGVEPTCTTPGLGDDGLRCMRCGQVVKEPTVLPALGHDFHDGVCSRCGATEGPSPIDGGWTQEISEGGRYYKVVCFTNTNEGGFTWKVPEGVRLVEYLLVGGGGGGGPGAARSGGGGGGAGGFVTGTAIVSPGEECLAVVGAGGPGCEAGQGVQPANCGGKSTFTVGRLALEARGGGSATLSGGSGGGGAGWSTTSPGHAYLGQGSGGGAGGGFGAGGGGGAATSGSACSSYTGGAGGEGRKSSISGREVMYAAGGGGGAAGGSGDSAPGGKGGSDIGGNGGGGKGDTYVAATPGLDGTGSGGGGGAANAGVAAAGARGGSGVVVLRYEISGEEDIQPYCGWRRELKIDGLDYVVEAYTNTGSGSIAWPVPQGVNEIEYLVVGGGGGGGGQCGSNSTPISGGGGGAGSFHTAKAAVSSGEVLKVTVGAGGAGGGNVKVQISVAPGANGGDSELAFGNGTSVRSLGGGGGGSGKAGKGQDGGSGGGGGWQGSGGKGLDGHDSIWTSGSNTGGGGGAGTAGDAASDRGGNGGDGLPCSITGEEVWYAAGGGGGGTSNYPRGLGGKGGGGDGWGKDASGTERYSTPGEPGTGSGGGGENNRVFGAPGGHGIVVIRYVKPNVNYATASFDVLHGAEFKSDTVKGSVRLYFGAAVVGARVKVVQKSAGGAELASAEKILLPVEEAQAFSFDFNERFSRGSCYLYEVSVTFEGDAQPSFTSTRVSFAATPVAWIYENAATFEDGGATGRWKLGSDEWATVQGDVISFNTFDESTQGYRDVDFTPTEPLAEGESATFRFKAAFDDAATVQPDLTGKFGVTLYSRPGEDGEDELVFLVLGNGEWHEVPPETFAPVLGATYEFTVALEDGGYMRWVSYAVASEGGAPAYLGSWGVPFDESRFAGLSFRGAGSLALMQGDRIDPSLVHAEVSLDGDVEPGANFTNLTVRGTVTITELCETSADRGSYVVSLRDSAGEVVQSWTNAFAAAGTYSFEHVAEGLTQGAGYSVDVRTVLDGGESPTEPPRLGGDTEFNAAAYAAQGPVHWIDEDAATFEAGGATGAWQYAPGHAVSASTLALGPCVGINSGLADSVGFVPSATDPAVTLSSLREIRCRFSCDAPGITVPNPVSPGAISGQDVACLTIAYDERADRCYFAVLSNGTWAVSDVEATLGEAAEVAIAINYHDPCVTYSLVRGGTRVPIATVVPDEGLPTPSADYRNRVGFCGSGAVAKLEGDCFDAHLATVGGERFWTIDEAIQAATATGNTVSPLWRTISAVGARSGKFAVYDPDGKLTLVWPLGYDYTSERSGDLTYYVFTVSDLWIHWAEEAGVVRNEGGYTVLSAAGLAYLAKMSAAEGLAGTVTLADDLTNMAAHVWTPIRDFRGTFDGAGNTIDGLTNKGWDGCVTNELGVTGYGLFGSATDATFRDVTFANVAISNSAEAVAALVGVTSGRLTVSGVTVASGRVEGDGSKVAGLVGLAEDYPELTLADSRNAADVVSGAAARGVPAYAAGLANIGGLTNESAAVTVTVKDNANFGAIFASVGAGEEGGNVAQVLGGTKAAARFDRGQVVVSGNVGAGDDSAVELQGMDRQHVVDLPVVNFASRVAEAEAGDARADGQWSFRRFIEADGATRPLFDLYYRTALLSGATFYNGEPNAAGEINDAIAQLNPGDTYTLAGNTTIWLPVVIDRNLVFNLNEGKLEQSFEKPAFEVADGVQATVRDGTVIFPKGRFAEVGEGATCATDGVTKVEWTTNYWDRVSVDGEPVGGSTRSLLTVLSLVRSGRTIETEPGSPVSINPETAEVELEGQVVAPLPSCYSVTRTVDRDGTVTYAIELKPEAELAPELALDLSAAVAAGKAKVVVSGTSSGLEYALLRKASIADEWPEPEAWMSPAKDGEAIVFEAETEGASGFFCIRAREKGGR